MSEPSAPGGGRHFTALPPLSLYVHLPWCAKKCPYCDFNSHEARGEIPEADYVDALLVDLAAELPSVWGRGIVSVFLGGGTPSLFSAEALDRLLGGIRALTALPPNVEITLEANPGTVERGRFADYRAIGVNRLSIGVQSFDDDALAALGRIHSADEARRAIEDARAAGFDAFNLDLMFALPAQDARGALADVESALAFEPPHLSCYELTIEPNTLFARFPPALPDEDARAAIQRPIVERLAVAGLERYEVSAFARPGAACAHNLNYWRFGDYVGIGAGAHGKISRADDGTIVRRWKTKHPARYLALAADPAAGEDRLVGGETRVPLADSGLEFMMNALRLVDGFELPLFERHTGVPLDRWSRAIERAREAGLLEQAGLALRPTPRGLDCLNDLLLHFLDDESDAEPDAPRRYPVIPLARADGSGGSPSAPPSEGAPPSSSSADAGTRAAGWDRFATHDGGDGAPRR